MECTVLALDMQFCSDWASGCLPTRSGYSWRFSGRGRGHLWNTSLQRLVGFALILLSELGASGF